MCIDYLTHETFSEKWVYFLSLYQTSDPLDTTRLPHINKSPLLISKHHIFWPSYFSYPTQIMKFKAENVHET
jgi:hypothetical protein